MERYLRPLPLLAAAFVVRAALALWTETLGADGAYHLMTAQGFLDGRFGDLLGAYRMHPLNPILTGLAGALLGGVEAGGAAVGVVLSSLSLLPLYLLARRLWNERIAGWAGLLYALHPTLVHEGTEVLNTGSYLFFFLSALALGVFALENGRLGLFALCGAACGLLYLTRPEGLLLPFFLVLMAAGRLKTGGRRLLAGGLLAGSVGLLIAAPYLLWLREHTGRWTLTDRQAAKILASSDAEAPRERKTRPAYKIFKTVVKAQHPVLLPLLVLGLLFHRRQGGSRRNLAWASALSAAVLAPSILLLLKSGTVSPSHRYFLPAISLLLPWTAAGLLVLRDAAGRFAWAPAALVVAALLAKDIGPRRAEERTLREAGLWIRAHAAAGERALVAGSEKIAWYAGLRPESIDFADGPAAGVREAARRSGASLCALETGTLERHFDAGAEETLRQAGFEPLASFERPGRDTVRVYRRKDVK